MKKYFLLLTIFFVSLLYSNHSYATIINARADGNWNESTTWLGGTIPGPFDSVIIDGFTVTVNTHVIVKSISVTNASNDIAQFAEANGIDNLDDLIVVGLTEDVGAERWNSYRNGGTTGTTGAGAGSIVTGDPPPFGVFKFTIGSGEPTNSLPVDLMKFQAIEQNSIVNLNWQSASESNSSHYEVERSLDGRTYKKLSMVYSAGDTEIVQDYFSTDRSPYYGYNYYRLKMVDRDGTFEYSPVEVVKIDVAPNVTIFPNPVKDVIKLTKEFSNEEEDVIEIYNINGQKIYSDKASFNDGYFQISTNSVDLLIPGTYFLRITNGTKNQVLKFIKAE